jgi:hypothetical protein
MRINKRLSDLESEQEKRRQREIETLTVSDHPVPTETEIKELVHRLAMPLRVAADLWPEFFSRS